MRRRGRHSSSANSGARKQVCELVNRGELRTTVRVKPKASDVIHYRLITVALVPFPYRQLLVGPTHDVSICDRLSVDVRRRLAMEPRNRKGAYSRSQFYAHYECIVSSDAFVSASVSLSCRQRVHLFNSLLPSKCEGHRIRTGARPRGTDNPAATRFMLESCFYQSSTAPHVECPVR
jgi:hypothetical protein